MTEIPTKWFDRFANEARMWRSYSSCRRTRVGAVIIDPTTRAIVSTGYNGTVPGSPSCNEGGCKRCEEAAAQGLPPGAVREYLDCECVHAEMNALLLAAQRGTKVADCLIFVTHEPCMSCKKHLTVARVAWVVCRET